MVKKKLYVAPSTDIIMVEVESAICGGSVDITAKSPGATTDSQIVNTDFETDNDFTDTPNNSWD